MSADHDSPAVEWMERMRLAFQQAITPDDMREIARNIADRAKRGDREATRLLMTYVMPPPVQTTEHRRLTVQAQAPKALPNGRPKVVEAREG